MSQGARGMIELRNPREMVQHNVEVGTILGVSSGTTTRGFGNQGAYRTGNNDDRGGDERCVSRRRRGWV